MPGWTAPPRAVRAHYDLVRARATPDGVAVPDFPAEPHEFTVELRGDEVSIGRRPVPDEAPATPSESVPGIDLVGPPRDPGVSRLHAVLLAVGEDPQNLIVYAALGTGAGRWWESTNRAARKLAGTARTAATSGAIRSSTPRVTSPTTPIVVAAMLTAWDAG